MTDFILQYQPNAVIHCAVYTAVDKAEDEPDLCYNINVAVAKSIAEICKIIDAELIHISTDYVFPGVGDKYYGVDDATLPLNTYGKTKLAGEVAVKETHDKYFIVRIFWAFGKNSNNFVKTMLQLGKERDELKIVNNQIGLPTYTADLAVLLCDMVIA